MNKDVNKAEEILNKDVNKAEEIMNKAEESLNKPKRNVVWTEERREAQRIRMAKLHGAQKNFKGKELNKSEEAPNKPEEPEEIMNNDEKPVGYSWGYYSMVIVVIILTVLGAVIFFIKTGQIKHEAENNE